MGGGYEVLCFDWDSGPLPKEGEGYVKFPYLSGGGYVNFLPKVGRGHVEFSYLRWAGHVMFLPEMGGGPVNFPYLRGRGIREVLT